jgi:hypothetical protein
MAINAGTNQLLQLSQQFSSNPAERAAGQEYARQLAEQREAQRIADEQEFSAFQAEAARLEEERRLDRQRAIQSISSTELQRIPTTDFGLDWQTQMMNQLSYGGDLPSVMTGGVNPVNTFDIMGFYDRGVGFGDYPTSVNLPVGMATIFPALGYGPSQDSATNLNEKSQIVRDIRGQFTPYYYNAETDGYSAPTGTAGPGGVIFNSGLGKTNENPGDYKTPGAGLWAAGFDLNDPLLLQKLYDHFGTNRGEVWDKYKPQKLEDGSWKKATPQDALAFVSDADEWFRKEALKMDLPKRGITDSLAGQLITGALIGAATGGFGTIVGGLTGSSALGNLASLAVNTAIGGAQGGWGGALTSALGSSIGAGMDQAGGWSNIGDFLSDPFGYIGSAYGIGGGAFSGLNLAGMGEAAQVGPGSLAEVTPASTEAGVLGQNVIRRDYIDGIPHEVVEVFADEGDVVQMGGGLGSAFGGGAGSVLGDLLTEGVGGLLDAGPSIPGTPGNPTGSMQTTAPSQTAVFGGPGGISPDEMPIGIPGVDAPYAPGSYQGQIGAVDGIVGGDPFGSIGTSGTQPGGQYNDSKFDLTGNLIPSLGPWDFTGATSGPGTPNATGLLDTGTGLAGTGPGGNGLGGDGTGGDGLGGDGLGMGSGGFNYSGLLGGMTPGGMGDPVSFLKPRAFGTKKKGPASFYGKLQAPKKRKGITVRRA